MQSKYKPFYVNGVTMSHNTLPTVAELSGEMRERLAKVKYVFTASISAPQTIAANLAAATVVTIHIYNILAEGNNHSVGKSVFSTKSVNIQSFKKNVKRRKAA